MLLSNDVIHYIGWNNKDRICGCSGKTERAVKELVIKVPVSNPNDRINQVRIMDGSKMD